MGTGSAATRALSVAPQDGGSRGRQPEMRLRTPGGGVRLPAQCFTGRALGKLGDWPRVQAVPGAFSAPPATWEPIGPETFSCTGRQGVLAAVDSPDPGPSTAPRPDRIPKTLGAP
jgi:hypothetical protein